MLDKISPVILIPGDGGSQIEAKLDKQTVPHYICAKQSTDFFNIWLNLELLVPLVIDCWVDNMRLVYDNTTRATQNAPGVETRVPFFGDPFSVEYLDPSKASAGAYFRDLGNALVALGYERNVSLRGAPYDFRKAPNENEAWFGDFRALIEETHKLNGGKQGVVLVAHSMGALMTLHFLQSMPQSWKDTHVAAFVSLAGAYGGSVKAVKVYAIGDDLGTYVLRQKTLREMQITSSSLAYLLPSPLFWKPNETLVITNSQNYTLTNLQDFFTEISFPDAWEMWQDTQAYKHNFTAPGVEVHCLHGNNVKTIERLIYKKDKFPDGDPSFEYGDGDGTVNRRSLEGCLHWTKAQAQKVYHEVFPKVDHMGILANKDIINYVLSVLEKL